MILLNMIGENIKHKTLRNSSLSPEIQLLIALRYYATGTFQVGVFLETTYIIKALCMYIL